MVARPYRHVATRDHGRRSPPRERQVALGIFRLWRVATRGLPVGAAAEYGTRFSLANTSHAKLGLGAPRGDTGERAERDWEDGNVRSDNRAWGARAQIHGSPVENPNHGTGRHTTDTCLQFCACRLSPFAGLLSVDVHARSPQFTPEPWSGAPRNCGKHAVAGRPIIQANPGTVRTAELLPKAVAFGRVVRATHQHFSSNRFGFGAHSLQKRNPEVYLVGTPCPGTSPWPQHHSAGRRPYVPERRRYGK